jgi:hypothetical protein
MGKHTLKIEGFASSGELGLGVAKLRALTTSSSVEAHVGQTMVSGNLRTVGSNIFVGDTLLPTKINHGNLRWLAVTGNRKYHYCQPKFWLAVITVLDLLGQDK